MDDELVPICVRLDRQTVEAVRRWADDEDRTMAQQIRRVLRGQVPVKFIQTEQSVAATPAGSVRASDEGTER